MIGASAVSGTKDTGRKETLRRLKPYPAYKDSGVEGLGKIPAHWKALKLKRVCTFAYGDSLATDVRLDGDIEVYGSNGPVGTHERANTLAPCLVIGRKGSFGKVNFSTRPVFAIDTTFLVDSRFTEADMRWLYYALSDARLDSVTKDSTVPGLDREDAYSRDVCTCTQSEQRTIADFLDREAARIDALVAKKERLIELLQEKRTALITRAVTKGLDPRVPMKDSGVEWLAEIPAHWDVRPNAYLFTERNERGRDDLPILEVSIASGVRRREFSETKIEQRSDDLGAYKVAKAGDIAFNKMRMWQGAVGAAPADGLVSPDYIVACPRIGTEPNYYSLVFRTQMYMAEVYRWSHGIVDDRNRLYWDDFKAIRSPCPPTGEQRAIVAFLEGETVRIDALITKVRDAIDRLNELRTALISAAVTGKIDVRGEVA